MISPAAGRGASRLDPLPRLPLGLATLANGHLAVGRRLEAAHRTVLECARCLVPPPLLIALLAVAAVDAQLAALQRRLEAVVDVSIVRIQNQLVILCHVKYLRVALGPLPTVTPHHLGTTGRTWVHACSVLCAPEHPSEFGVGQHIHPAFRVDLLQKPIETFALVLLANGNHLRDITRALARVRQELLHQVLVLFVHPHFDCTPLVLVGGGRPFPPAVLAHATPHVTDPRAAHKFNRPAALPYAEPNLDVLAAPV
mmetsp:Transcript_9225/g.23674  ORF Transcript_9225/g.23674 Transcript_9225/m.23674 type:complete len:255 (-) Transcript_9225:887-1651(-)